MAQNLLNFAYRSTVRISEESCQRSQPAWPGCLSERAGALMLTGMLTASQEETRRLKGGPPVMHIHLIWEGGRSTVGPTASRLCQLD